MQPTPNDAHSHPWPADVHLHHGGLPCLIRTLPIDRAQPLFYDWTANEGWNPGLTDPTLFSTLDPHGFHVLYALTPAAPSSPPSPPALTPVCLLSTLLVSPSRAFLGPYITSPAYRGQGFGSFLFSFGLSRLQAQQRSVGLDSTLEQQPWYRRRGFVHTLGVEQRYSGLVDAAAQRKSDTDCEVLPALRPRVEEGQVHALYTACSESSMATPAFVAALLRQPGCHALVAQSKEGEVLGLVVARRAGVGYRVAPLFAADDHIARALLVAVQDAVGRGDAASCSLHIDVPATRKPALQLVEEVGLRPIFQSVRMSTGPPAAIRGDWVFGSEPVP